MDKEKRNKDIWNIDRMKKRELILYSFQFTIILLSFRFATGDYYGKLLLFMSVFGSFRI